MLILRQCAHCGADFQVRALRLKDGRGKFCSKKCFYASRSNTRTYPAEMQAYSDAKRRCTNPYCETNARRYKDRGIEFRFNSFQEFIDHIGPRPEECSLDRIDNDGHYEIGNVRWATRKQQAANRDNSYGVFNLHPHLREASGLRQT